MVLEGKPRRVYNTVFTNLRRWRTFVRWLGWTASLQTLEKQHAAQMARRKEILEILGAKDQAGTVRPKGYEPNNSLEGYEASFSRGFRLDVLDE